MGCGCNQRKSASAGQTTAQIAERPYLVRASDGSEQRFASYDDAVRYARRVSGTIQQ